MQFQDFRHVNITFYNALEWRVSVPLAHGAFSANRFAAFGLGRTLFDQHLMVHLGEVGPVVWDQIMDEMEKKLVDINFKRAEVQPDWRKLAHRRKFEREAFAKYGYFKDFVLHPKVQMVKHYVDENAHFDNIMSGEPLISPTNGLILLFMVSRRLDMSITMLLAAFLFNLNPVYVSMAIVGMMFMKTSRKPKGALPRRRSPADTSNYRARPLHTMDKSYLEKDPYDHVLIGGDLGTFYTAALLSKCGHRCLVLQPSNTPALQVCLFFIFFSLRVCSLLFVCCRFIQLELPVQHP